jgi:SMC interacting uncharacterized protein involved in chromosome segregation
MPWIDQAWTRNGSQRHNETGQPTQVVSKSSISPSVVSSAVASTIDGRGNLIKPNLQANPAQGNTTTTQVASLESQLQNNIRRSQALRVNAYLSNSLMGSSNGSEKVSGKKLPP